MCSLICNINIIYFVYFYNNIIFCIYYLHIYKIMNTFIYICIFAIVFVLYVHIMHQYKKSKDLEIYQLDYKNNENLQETCDILQPFVFLFQPVISQYPEINLGTISTINTENILNVKDINDYYNGGENIPVEVAFTFENTLKLMKTDTHIHYFTENNNSFLEEVGLEECMTRIGNKYLKPSYNVIQSFDLLTGTTLVTTPLKYHTNSRKFLYVSNGKISIKTTIFKNAKNLELTDNNYSCINVWNPQKEYISNVNKTRFLEFEVEKGHVLYIPPYWLYSIKYLEDDTCILEYNYSTFMNIISHPMPLVNSCYSTIQSIFPSNILNKYNTVKEDNGQFDEKNVEHSDENSDEENNLHSDENIVSKSISSVTNEPLNSKLDIT